MQNKQIHIKTKQLQYNCTTIPTPSCKAESNARSLSRHSSTVTALLSPFVKTTSPLFQSKPVSLFVFVFVHFSNPNLSLSLCICIYHPVFACFLKPLHAYTFSLFINTWLSHHTSVLRRDFALCCGIKYKWCSNSV